MSGPAQLWPDNVCLNFSCVCLFQDASVGYPILPVDTDDSSEYTLLELLHFHIARMQPTHIKLIPSGGQALQHIEYNMPCL